MPINRELEIKFRTDAAGLNLALASKLLSTGATDAPKRSLRSIYFDTSSGDLKSHGITLRVRKTRGAHIMGLKWAASPTEGPFSRGEVEVRLSAAKPEIARFGAEIASELNRLTGGRPLEQQFETQIKRRLHSIDIGGAVVDVAFDEGFILAGEKRLPLTEVELELKSGEATLLYDLGIKCAESLPIRLDRLSKAERGFLLAAGESPPPAPATSLQFPRDATIGDAVTTVVGAALRHFLTNWPALNPKHCSEAVHQMRVALRRLRTACTLFKRALPYPEFETFRAEAKRIASELGGARTWDVLREMVELGPLTHHQRDESFDALLKAIEERRRLAYDTAQALIDDPATTGFVLSLQAFLARQRSQVGAGERSEPAQLLAVQILERLHNRVLKRGKRLLHRSSAERHKVRIALKNLRYAAEFFSELFGGPSSTKRYLRRIARLQDLLGASNDAAGAAELCKDLEMSAPQAAKAAGIVLGWYGRGAKFADDKLRDVWRSFAHNDPFWRRSFSCA